MKSIATLGACAKRACTRSISSAIGISGQYHLRHARRLSGDGGDTIFFRRHQGRQFFFVFCRNISYKHRRCAISAELKLQEGQQRGIAHPSMRLQRAYFDNILAKKCIKAS